MHDQGNEILYCETTLKSSDQVVISMRFMVSVALINLLQLVILFTFCNFISLTEHVFCIIDCFCFLILLYVSYVLSYSCMYRRMYCRTYSTHLVVRVK